MVLRCWISTILSNIKFIAIKKPNIAVTGVLLNDIGIPLQTKINWMVTFKTVNSELIHMNYKLNHLVGILSCVF